MTIEEKARAYDEAMNKIKPLYEQAKRDDNPIWSTYEYLIPELAESEDEKFRRYILNCCEVTIEEGDRGLELSMSTTKKLKAWLEKHKEHNYLSDETERFDLPEDWIEKRKLECPFKRQLDKNFYGCNRYEGVVGVCDGHCSWVVDYPKLKEFKDRIKNKMEQEDGVLTQIKNMEPISSDITLEKIEKATDELVQEVEKEQLEQKFTNNKSEQQDWSEEDEKVYTFVYDFLENCWWNKTWDISRKQVLKMLKSLRPQPKPKWDEFDEDCLKRAIWYVKNPAPSVIKDSRLALWLNMLRSRFSLHSQPHWKPSEEQMEALKNSAYGTYQNGDGPALRELYEQLKKLI